VHSQLLVQAGGKHPIVLGVELSGPFFLSQAGQRASIKRILASGFFLESSYPNPPKITLGSFQIFSNFAGYSHVKEHHRYQQHRQKILPLELLVLLKPVANLLPVSTIPVANLLPVSTTLVANNGNNIGLLTS
jgi:hypothetical protein